MIESRASLFRMYVGMRTFGIKMKSNLGWFHVLILD